jgi:hypothetical protein
VAKLTGSVLWHEVVLTVLLFVATGLVTYGVKNPKFEALKLFVVVIFFGLVLAAWLHGWDFALFFINFLASFKAKFPDGTELRENFNKSTVN